jgi:hypothetical protein
LYFSSVGRGKEARIVLAGQEKELPSTLLSEVTHIVDAKVCPYHSVVHARVPICPYFSRERFKELRIRVRFILKGWFFGCYD